MKLNALNWRVRVETRTIYWLGGNCYNDGGDFMYDIVNNRYLYGGESTTDQGGGVVRVPVWPASSIDNGDWCWISGTTYYDGYHKILDHSTVGVDWIEIEYPSGSYQAETFDGSEYFQVCYDSNWSYGNLNAAGVPAFAPVPRDGDILVFDGLHAAVVPEFDYSSMDYDEMMEYLEDPWHWNKYLNGQERGTNYNPNFYYDEYFSLRYSWSGRIAIKKLIVKPSYNGQIGVARDWAYDWDIGENRWTIPVVNALPIHTEEGGSIEINSQYDHYIRCSGKVDNVTYNYPGDSWTDNGGDARESVSIDNLVTMGNGGVFISSQLNDATYTSLWKNVKSIKGGIVALREEIYDESMDDWFSGQSIGTKERDYAVGTPVDIASTYSDDSTITIERDCLNLADSDGPPDLNAIRGDIQCFTSTGAIVCFHGHIRIGEYVVVEQTVGNIASIIMYGGRVEWKARGTLSEGTINGGKLVLLGDATKTVGEDADTILLNSGVIDLSQAQGKIDLGINNCNVRIRNGKLYPQVENKYEYSSII